MVEEIRFIALQDLLEKLNCTHVLGRQEDLACTNINEIKYIENYLTVICKGTIHRILWCSHIHKLLNVNLHWSFFLKHIAWLMRLLFGICGCAGKHKLFVRDLIGLHIETNSIHLSWSNCSDSVIRRWFQWRSLGWARFFALLLANHLSIDHLFRINKLIRFSRLPG